MDNKKLADLLIPNAISLDDLYKQYPQRKLKEGERVLRVAPSPTGYLHLGTFFSALCQYLETRINGGTFYVRLEDTDQKREVTGAGDVIIEMLNYFGIFPDEGYMGDTTAEVGKYGPYVQSKRLHIYRAFAHHLIMAGRAFPCFCSKTENKQDVLQNREKALAEGGQISEKDICRDLTFEEIESNIKAKKPFAIRLKSLGDGASTFKFTDYFKGEREIRQNAKDIVLLKADGFPTYALGHLADDTLMGTTIIVRGEEWYPSLSAHLELFEACGYKWKKYGHAPLICLKDEETGNKRKFSKRKDPRADMRYYAQCGYPKEAIWEYILSFANSNFEDWRRTNPREDLLKFPFKLSRLGSNNPYFDGAKLEDVSKNVISKCSAQNIFDAALAWAKLYDKEFADYLTKNKQRALAIFGIDRAPEKARKDIAKWSDIKTLYGYLFENAFEYEEKPADKKVLEEYLLYGALPESKETWFENVKQIAGKLGYAVDTKEYKNNPSSYKGSITDVVTNIRLAITGRKNSPDLYEICKILGKQEVENRLKK